MKNRFLVLPALFFAAAFARPAHADLLTYFNFNDSDLVSDGGLRSSTITYDFADGEQGDIFSNSSDAGSDQNLVAGDVKGNGLVLFKTTINGDDNAGKYIQFNVSTTGFSNVKLSFATVNNFDGFNSNSILYSTDGTNFTSFTGTGSPYTPTSTFSTQTIDLTSVAGLNDNANASFRIMFGGGAGTNPNANNYLDNIQVNAESTPEPSTWALTLMGLGAAVLIMRRRKQDEETKEKARVRVPVRA